MKLGRMLVGCALSALCLLSGIAGAGGQIPPTISKAFGAPTMLLGASTSLGFSLSNDPSNTTLTGIAFTDVLPSGLVVDTPNGLNGGCGGDIVAVPGSNTIMLTGAVLAADSSCNFRVDVTAVAVGLQNNVTNKVTSTESGAGGSASATVLVTVQQITNVKSFAPASIAPGGIATLTIALTNNDMIFDALAITLTDAFPAGMSLAAGQQTNTCGGVLVASASNLSLTNGFLKFAGVCSITVPVTAVAPGTLTNVTSPITCISSQGLCSGNAAGANLVVTGNTPPNVPPVITSGPPPPGTVGIYYSFPVTATGSPTPTFSVSGLPPGLFYSVPGNLIYGTPTQDGTFTATIIASNGVQPDAVGIYPIGIVNPLSIIIAGGGVLLPVGTPGIPYGPVTFAGSGGNPPYTFSACGLPLPPGLTLATNGTLAGTPTQTGSFTFDVCLQDSGGTTKKQPFTVLIVAVTPVMSITVTPNVAVSGQAVDVSVQVAGATTIATGIVEFWMAGTGTKCPPPFVLAGAPGDPVAAVRTATLDATGRARLTYANLRIDDYFVCARYTGDGLYPPAIAGPVSLSVIKGVLLPPPAVTLSVPASVVPAATLTARIVVAGNDGSPVPQGVVRVRVATNEIATASLANGSATITVRMPEAGVVTFAADYAGDANYPPASSDSATVEVGNGLAVSGVPIPTLSEWALAMIALLLGLLGWRRLRKD